MTQTKIFARIPLKIPESNVQYLKNKKKTCLMRDKKHMILTLQSVQS